jgi:hypothetical protein
MTRTSRALVFSFLALVLVRPAAAQDPLNTRVSLDLKAMAPADAFKVIADAIGRQAAVDPAVTAPVDILVRNVTARTALSTICESIGCRWTADAAGIAVKPESGEPAASVAGGRAALRVRGRVAGIRAERLRVMLKRPLPAGTVFQNAPWSEVNARLSEALGVQVAIETQDPALQTVTGDFGNMTLQAVLKTLVERTTGRRTALRISLGEKGSETPPSLWIMLGAGKPATR